MTQQLLAPPELRPLGSSAARSRSQILCAGGFLLPSPHVGLVTDPRDELTQLLFSEPSRSSAAAGRLEKGASRF